MNHIHRDQLSEEMKVTIGGPGNGQQQVHLAILGELVALKAMKDSIERHQAHGGLQANDGTELEGDYARCKPRAWQAALDAVASAAIEPEQSRNAQGRG